MELPRNPHDDHLRRSWRLCRFGLGETAEVAKRQRVIAWLDRMRHRLPGSPHLALWSEIVSGQAPELAREMAATTDYFELPEERRGVWRPLVQSQPFTCLLPGRTTRERRAVLSRLP